VLDALGVSETPVGDGEDNEAGPSSSHEDRNDGDTVATITNLAASVARSRGAASVGTGEILVAVIQFYSPDFDIVLEAAGTDRDEVIGHLAA
jgi:hypothetical protein